MSAPDSWEEHAAGEETQQAPAQEETQQNEQPEAEPEAETAEAEAETAEAEAEGDTEADGAELTSPQTETSEAGGAPKGKKGKKEVVRDPRPHVNLVFIGHVDAGKSTISGHILYLTGMVDERTMEKYEREAKQKNRESWKYAWAMDVSEAERDKGKTHETGSGYFATKNRRFTILDAPGHKAFVPSMIGGACQADLAVLVISARRGEFETGFERGGQTREHAILTKTAGVKHLFVVINKMDDPTVDWQKSRYDEIVGKLSPFLKGVGWLPNQTQYLPVSGLGGLNLAERLDPKQVPCDWYNDQCLLEMLDTVEMADMDEAEPLRFPIQGKFREMGVCVHGRNESGAFSVGDKLYMMPPKVPVTVDAILHDTDEVERCYPGDNVLVKLKGVEEEDIHVGFVLCEIARPLPIAIAFTAQVLLLETKHIIAPGYKCVMHIHAVAEECEFEKLACTLDKKTGKPAVKAPPFVKAGDKVLAHMKMNQAICLETFKVFSKLGRFILRDEAKTIGVGVVMRILA